MAIARHRLWLLSLAGSCAAPVAQEAAQDTAVSEASVSAAESVIPGPGIDVAVMPSNNNLDVISHEIVDPDDGTPEAAVFLAWRTAPTHFASAETQLHIVRSTDQQTWTHEATLHLGTDLREPRFLSWQGELLLYFAALGTSATDFEPGQTYRSVRSDDGTWSTPELAFDDGFIPWRIYEWDGAPVMVGYIGGDEIYDLGEDTGDYDPQLEVKLLTTEDGRTWEALVPGRPTVHTGGGSETAIARLEDGTLVAVMRNEAGDEDGWGSKVCRAEADALADWTCAPDKRKYDSPLVFRHGSRVWLVGRRNVTDTGHYDLGYDHLDAREATLQYQIDYWNHPKRCSLWEVDPDALTVTFALDLPSRGDTCFPSALPAGGDDWTVYNYSSPVEGPDVTWLQGQLGDTNIYRQTLTLPR
jgi:hypothetical protein